MRRNSLPGLPGLPRLPGLPGLPGLRLTILLSLVALGAGCVAAAPDDPEGTEDTGEIASLSTLAEGFESGSKTAYAVADVTLGTGLWNLDEALIGTSTSDLKSGARSARVRNSGRITMKFDRVGAATVTIRHGSFGTDGSGTWALFSSQNGGGTWTQVGTSRSTTSSLGTATFTVDLTGTVRFQIRKLDGGANRINIDDISITDPDGGGGGGGGGGGPGADLSVHTTLGLPSPSSTSDPNSYLSVKPGYVLSYNSSRKVPNWVSWEINTSYFGSIDRQDDFRIDSTLPSTLPQATLADYSGSGYDRGHMCPSADRTRTTTANSETFYLTNMIPQAGNNNRGPWANLEEYSRSLAQTGKDLFVIAGGTFSSSSASIGNGVKVPDQTFKVIVVLDAPGQGPGNVTANTRVIGVLMPNRDSQISLSAPWRNFRVSIDQLEALTGHDYLSDVDPAVQAIIEARVDNL